jgi:hypothetical protein
MPIDSVTQIPIEANDTPFNRLAIRCSLTATLTGNALTAGTIALHATRYRKFTRQTITIIDTCGHERGEMGMTGNRGDSAAVDDLIQAIARRCRNYVAPAGTSAVISLNFAWRRKAGDLTGMIHMEVTPAGGEKITVAHGDTVDLEAADPVFLDFYRSIFTAIKNRSDALGW